MREIVVAITGASGVIYGVKLLQALRDAGQPTALILSEYAVQLLETETDCTPQQVKSWADAVYDEHDFSAPIASGSHRFRGMAVCPCSMKTLGSIANGIASNLVVRAAEVCLKEGRPLVLVPRETPLSVVHIENMLRAARAGSRIAPANPGFYMHPRGIDDLVDGVVARVLDLLSVEHAVGRRWGD